MGSLGIWMLITPKLKNVTLMLLRKTNQNRFLISDIYGCLGLGLSQRIQLMKNGERKRSSMSTELGVVYIISFADRYWEKCSTKAPCKIVQFVEPVLTLGEHLLPGFIGYADIGVDILRTEVAALHDLLAQVFKNVFPFDED
eukprot:m.88678 g.88678  ORF g.88678 m.88678 type:complete len:142 (+) comp13180_c0_seq2:3653-4078(+)